MNTQYRNSVVMLIMAMLSLAGCASRSIDERIAEAQRAGAGTHQATELPAWVTEEPEPESPFVFYGTGFSYPDHAASSAMRRMARSEAMGELASQIRTLSQGVSDSYFRQYGTAQGQINLEREDTLRDSWSQRLTGARVVNSAVTADGQWIVRMRVDISEDFNDVLRRAGVTNPQEQAEVRELARQHREEMLRTLGSER